MYQFDQLIVKTFGNSVMPIKCVRRGQSVSSGYSSRVLHPLSSVPKGCPPVCQRLDGSSPEGYIADTTLAVVTTLLVVIDWRPAIDIRERVCDNEPPANVSYPFWPFGF